MKKEIVENPKYNDLDDFTKKYGSIPVKNYFRSGRISMRKPYKGKDGGIIVNLSRCKVRISYVEIYTFEEKDGIEIAGKTSKTYNAEM